MELRGADVILSTLIGNIPNNSDKEAITAENNGDLVINTFLNVSELMQDKDLDIEYNHNHEFIISSFPKNNFTLTELGEKIMGHLSEDQFIGLLENNQHIQEEIDRHKNSSEFSPVVYVQVLPILVREAEITVGKRLW